ncbi:MAG TPA: protein-L-isoaspartate(D-aspartate) O-methyltransferase [Rhizomicrobium sp.]|jgi:protein-L-isoaspartate(D-aspartate) O-methyltransferase|nr:protein-L-isoaspartate(D-aspartate) O-methyltransferase [Rhizomicrobium sp.]
MNSDHRPAALVTALREQGISDARVLDAIEKTPREIFVDTPFAPSSYENIALPIACGQTISQPFIVAFASAALEVGPKMRVLELGTGSGYQAAVLSPLARMVYTIERHRPLLREAQARFKKLKLHNIVTRFGDGLDGWPEQAPFHRILLSAAVEEVPPILIEQLKPGGILVAPVGKIDPVESISQSLVKIIRTQDGVTRQALIPVVFVPMVPGLPQDRSDAKDRKR